MGYPKPTWWEQLKLIPRILYWRFFEKPPKTPPKDEEAHNGL